MSAPAFWRAIAANASAIPCGVLASTGCIFTPTLSAAAWTFFSNAVMEALEGFTKYATRVTLGTIPRSISRRLGPSSAAMTEIPVVLPPGRARLLTKPLPTGSALIVTMGIAVVAFLRSKRRGRSYCCQDVHFQPHQLRRQFRQRLGFPLGGAPFDHEILADHITEFAHALRERAVVIVGIDKFHVTL